MVGRSLVARLSGGGVSLAAVELPVLLQDLPIYTTALFPKDGRYIVPVKDAVRNAEDLEVGDMVTVQLTVDV